MKTNIFISSLLALGVRYTRSHALYVFNAHPYKHSLYGLECLLRLYGVATNGLRVNDKSCISEIPAPFVAQYENDLVIVKDTSELNVVYERYGKEITSDINSFIEQWSGIVLLMTTSSTSIEPDYTLHHRQELQRKIEIIIFTVSSFLLNAYGLYITWSGDIWWRITYIALSGMGCFISTVLLTKQLHYESKTVDYICRVIQQGDCDSVLESSAARPMGWFSWSEIGTAWFATCLLTQLWFPHSTPLIACIALLSLPYTIWSIWYQKFRAKRWCVLCLSVICLLWMQVGTFALGSEYKLAKFDLSYCAVFPLGAIVLVFLRRVLENISFSHNEIQAQCAFRQLKSQQEVFETLLHMQPWHNTKEASCLIFGDINAEHQLTVFGNPHCEPCAHMHRRLQPLLDNGISIQYVLTYFTPELSEANRYLIAVYRHCGPERAWNLLSAWYDQENRPRSIKILEDAFSGKYDSLTSDIDHEVVCQWKWGNNNNIQGTPTLMFDGYEIPSDYEVEDLIYIY